MATGASDYPTSLDTTSNQPVASTLVSIELDGDGTANNIHSNVHGVHSTAIVQLETKIGTGASTATANKVLRATGTGTSAWGQVVLTSDVSGTLPTANGGTGTTGAISVGGGGTGATSLTDGGVLLGSGTSAITPMAVLSDGEMIVGNGSTDPVAESGATLRTSIGLGSVATRDTGISNNNIPIYTSGVADDDFLRIDGTTVEGRSASEVLSDIGAGAVAGSSSIATVGTVTTGTWQATDVGVAYGGTGASTATAGFDALSPMTAEGDILYGGTSGTVTKLAKGSDDEVLTLASGVPSWAAAGGGGITHASRWLYGTATANAAGWAQLTGTWTECNSYASGGGIIGASMSVSSGKWTFPATGIWYVALTYVGYGNSASFGGGGNGIYILDTNDDWGAGEGVYHSKGKQYYPSGSYPTQTSTISLLFDVTNVSNNEVMFATYAGGTTTVSDENGTNAVFIRLGDT